MLIEIQISKEDLKKLVITEIERRLGDIPLDKDKVSIQTKSKQNYKSEWEEAEFKAIYSNTVI